MRDDDVVDRHHFVEREVAHARAGIDEHGAVEQEGGRAAASGNGTRTTEDADLHGAAEDKSPHAPAHGQGAMLSRRPRQRKGGRHGFTRFGENSQPAP